MQSFSVKHKLPRDRLTLQAFFLFMMRHLRSYSVCESFNSQTCLERTVSCICFRSLKECCISF